MRTFAAIGTALAVLLTTLILGSASPASAGHPRTYLGPGDAKVNGIGGEAIIRKDKRWGYIYISGKHSSHLRIKYIERKNSLRYRDTRTHKATLPKRGCHREKVKKGISVVCKIPKKFDGKKVFVQVWPRLGNDYVDGRTLPKRFRLWVLADAGNDVVYGGDGADFVNGAKGNDRMYGGKGNDWLRGGPGADVIKGGAGKDRIAHG
ncbi:MAG: hypothetical protein CMH83_11275 [Nocardioides sp.]|nr:hypothetical protein [Nocardioides sp.]